MSAQGGYPGTPKLLLVAGCESAELASRTARGSWDTHSGERLPNKSPRLLNCVAGTQELERGKRSKHSPSTLSLLTSPTGRPACSILLIVRLRHAFSSMPSLEGVGTAAVQIGKLLGIEMYGTSSSEEKTGAGKELGLQHGINYKQRDYAEAIKELTNGEGVDAVFERGGQQHREESVCVRFWPGHCVRCRDLQPAILDARILYAKGASVHGLWLTYLSGNRTLMEEAWRNLSSWIANGHLHPVIGHVFPLEKAEEAYRLLLGGQECWQGASQADLISSKKSSRSVNHDGD